MTEFNTSHHEQRLNTLCAESLRRLKTKITSHTDFKISPGLVTVDDKLSIPIHNIKGDSVRVVRVHMTVLMSAMGRLVTVLESR